MPWFHPLVECARLDARDIRRYVDRLVETETVLRRGPKSLYAWLDHFELAQWLGPKKNCRNWFLIVTYRNTIVDILNTLLKMNWSSWGVDWLRLDISWWDDNSAWWWCRVRYWNKLNSVTILCLSLNVDTLIAEKGIYSKTVGDIYNFLAKNTTSSTDGKCHCWQIKIVWLMCLDFFCDVKRLNFEKWERRKKNWAALRQTIKKLTSSHCYCVSGHDGA